ncbi:MAG: hydroxymethylglutaryl-CoA reductase, degradative [Candidatus Burarchaeum sp.]|nr:hydroxymethylglutaryl-CoA reductase, degradative [Candidatus Burarchaeum sp.]MDO8339463.1 hydroxymethylglutaryl-CoA reductase, degradative [Candidatus Burarchaeum sp.]
MDSSLAGFYKLPLAERRKKVAELAGLSADEAALLERFGSLDEATADRMIENVVGAFPLPLGIATNFKVNGRDYLVPMAVEEPSVVAAASNGAKVAREAGGFESSSNEPIMIGQIQLVGVKDFAKSKKAIADAKKALMEKANSYDSMLIKAGGGCKEIEVRELKSKRGKMLVVHLHVNCADAMGANAVNTMCERLAPDFEKLSGGKVRLRILTNLAVKRLARAKAVFPKSVLGEELIENILDAWALADCDPYRATTHNKGIMNGIDAVVVATGNDWRAIEAGAHSYAAISGEYKPLTRYTKNAAGDLVGEIELPLALGLVGGATKTHPVAKVCVKLLGVKTARELAEVVAAVGLAQNFAALRALAGEGIQRGHMGLHARNIAVMAGAKGAQIDEIAEKMAKEKNVSVTRAKELL